MGKDVSQTVHQGNVGQNLDWDKTWIGTEPGLGQNLELVVRCDLKVETETFLCVTQEQAIGTNVIGLLTNLL